MPACFRRLILPLLFLGLSVEGLNAQISSIQRTLYGYPLIDTLPRNQFPRGGTYLAVIQGGGLKDVTGFLASNPNVTGTVTSAADTSVTVQISSTAVEENDTAEAPIPAVSFTLLSTGGPIASGPVTFDIVVGPPTQITSFEVSNGVKWIPAGVATTVTYSVTALWAGNEQFWYVGCGQCVGSFGTFMGDQFSVSFSVTTVVTITSKTDTTFTAFVGGVDGAGQGGVLGNAPLSPRSLAPPIPVVQVQLLDPVPTLLDGSDVTADPTGLLSQGTAVSGVAADGIAQLVIRIAGAPPNETFSLNLTQDGTLANVGSGNPQTSISVQADGDGNAFALYRPPLDFARPGGADDARVSRAVDITFESADNPGVIGDTPITLVRPPVILIHGNWSNAANDWQFFQFFEPPPFQMFRIDYRAVLAQGVMASANFALTQIPIVIADFKTAALTQEGETISVAAIQADLVAYSLGGLVARALPTLRSFANSANFGAGYVHKLITLDTPHLGSELATPLMASGAACRTLFSIAVGPVGRNVQDMALGSAVLNQLKMPVASGIHLPTAAIVSVANSAQQVDAFSAYATSILRVFCPHLVPTPGGYQTLFTTPNNLNGDSDLIVSEYSQGATSLGIGGPIPVYSFRNVIHDVNPRLFPTGPDVRQSNIVQNLLSKDRVGVPAPFPSTEQVLALLNMQVAQFGRIAP